MANEKLFSRVKDYEKKKSEHHALADGLANELGNAIVERLLQLFEDRENKEASFPVWLQGQFNTDPYVAWDIFTKDSTLKRLLQAVDATQERRSKVADVVNVQLMKIPSSVGVNKSFVDVTAIGRTGPFQTSFTL